MNRAKIFQFIQASNTVTVFAASLMAIALFGGGAALLAADSLFSRQTYSGDSIAIEPEEESETKLELEGFRPLSGTPYLIADQVARQYKSRGVLSSSSYDKQVSTRNYLFFDGNGKTSHWLRPNSDFLFLEKRELTQSQDDADSTVQCLLYSLVKADSNDDQQLNYDDAKAIALSDPSGKNYQELIQNIDQVQQIHQQNDQRVLVFYRADEKHYVADIDFVQGKLLATQELPLAPN